MNFLGINYSGMKYFGMTRLSCKFWIWILQSLGMMQRCEKNSLFFLLCLAPLLLFSSKNKVIPLDRGILWTKKPISAQSQTRSRHPLRYEFALSILLLFSTTYLDKAQKHGTLLWGKQIISPLVNIFFSYVSNFSPEILIFDFLPRERVILTNVGKGLCNKTIIEDWSKA